MERKRERSHISVFIPKGLSPIIKCLAPPPNLAIRSPLSQLSMIASQVLLLPELTNSKQQKLGLQCTNLKIALSSQ